MSETMPHQRIRPSVFVPVLLATILFPATQALAGPAIIPVQGTLTDSEGVPLDGPTSIQLSIYDSAADGARLYTESTTAIVDRGHFSVNMGEATPLDMTIFRDVGETYLGITVGADPEMEPRLAIGAAPYAAFAQWADDTNTLDGLDSSAFAAIDHTHDVNLPSGMIAFFAGQCPPGFTEYVALRGRFLVGTPDTGTDEGTVGAALPDLGGRAITEIPAHDHVIDPPSANASFAGQHNHSVDPPDSWSSSAGGHTHTAYAPAHDSDTPYSQGWPGGDSHQSFRTSNRAGIRAVAAAAIGAVPGHQHSMNIGPFASAAAGNHNHQVDIPSFASSTTGTAAVDVTMPYLQLRACQVN